MASAIETVAVIGTGVIGASWASLFLAKGLKVLVTDPAPDAKEKFDQFVQNAWPALVKIGLEPGASKQNYEFVDDIWPRLADVDFVQENGPERVELKTRLIGEIDARTRPDVTIASSSSGLPSSQLLADCKQNPGRVLIGHPLNPPHLVPVVEVVPHPHTSQSIIDNAISFYHRLGKTPVLLSNEVPGFVANRLQAALNNEVYSLISRGIVSAQDIDTVVTNGLGLRWALNGPIMINSMGGGGGKDGFAQRFERLGSGIRDWERDIYEHRFDWSEAATENLMRRVSPYLDQTDSQRVQSGRDTALLELVTLKQKLSHDTSI